MNQPVIIAILAYSLCSSTLLLANKLLMHSWPFPSICSVLQLVFAVVALKLLKSLGYIEVDSLTWDKVKPFLPYVLCFALAIFANMKALEHSNVDTIIVFRACTPLVVSLLDWLFLGRALPSLRSWGCLILIGGGAAVYVLSDKQFFAEGVAGYTWVLIYFGLICTEMTYGKHIMNHTKLDSPIWGSVRFTNTLGMVPLLVLSLINNEPDRLSKSWDTLAMGPSAIALFLFTCIAGLAIGYSGFHCRSLISAASYTLVGVVNKLFTVLLNCLLWDNHASIIGLGALCVTIVGAAAYQQAPMREKHTPGLPV